MTKCLLSAVLNFCLICLVFGQEKIVKTDREWNHLKGPVKAVIYQDVPPAEDPDGVGEEFLRPFIPRRVITYDVNGKRIKEEPPILQCGGAWLEKQRKNVRAYDERGNLTKTLTYETDGRLIHKAIWTYDARGNMLTWKYYDGQRLAGKWIKSYSENGRRVESAQYGRRGILDHKEVDVKNEHGDIIEFASYKRDGSLSYKNSYDYEYDAQGNWIKETQAVSEIIDGREKIIRSFTRYRIITYM